MEKKQLYVPPKSRSKSVEQCFCCFFWSGLMTIDDFIFLIFSVLQLSSYMVSKEGNLSESGINIANIPLEELPHPNKLR